MNQPQSSSASTDICSDTRPDYSASSACSGSLCTDGQPCANGNSSDASSKSDNTDTSALPHALVVIPVFNHAGTLRQVVEQALAAQAQVLVVDDGSTDMSELPADTHGMEGLEYEPNAEDYICPGVENLAPNHPLYGLPVFFLRHRENKGKGAAIKNAAAFARQHGFSHIITIDADGQHNVADLPGFLAAMHEKPLAIWVGKRDFNTPNVPASSRFGRSFSNFWYKVQTEKTVGDSQCGFRLYPLAVLETVRCLENRYTFEIEVLVRAAWAGFEVNDIPISVYYPPGKERISHFHPVMDNFRLSILNTCLTIRSLMPVPQKKYVLDNAGNISVLHPLRSLRALLVSHETPHRLAFSAALGMALGTLPLIGLHCISIVLAAVALRLNKILALAVSQLCMPPFVPALCIEVGYFIRNGSFLTEISLRTLGYEALSRVVDWLVGSLVLAPALALLFGVGVYIATALLRRGLTLPAGQPDHTEQAEQEGKTGQEAHASHAVQPDQPAQTREGFASETVCGEENER